MPLVAAKLNFEQFHELERVAGGTYLSKWVTKKVIEAIKAAPKPAMTWPELWDKLLKAPDKAARFSKIAAGRQVPPEWKNMTREYKVRWLEQNWPLAEGFEWKGK